MRIKQQMPSAKGMFIQALNICNEKVELQINFI